MTTPIVVTGGTTVFGTAINNTGTDSFLLYGAGNTVVEGGGNLVVNGGNLAPYGWDTNSTIYLGNATQTSDQITLDGNQNTILSQFLYQSTVSIDITGLGLGGATLGGNLIGLDNAGGTTSLKIAGTNDNVTLNGDATNTIRLGGGYATVNVGALDGDGQFGYSTSLVLAGTHNSVTGGDENFTITGGAGHDQIALGDGNNYVHEQGGYNTIDVWGGTNVISAGSGHDTVNILGTLGDESAYFIYNPSIPIAGPPTDSVTISGLDDTVDATYENVVVSGQFVKGLANIDLGNGNNTVNLAGNASAVQLGNGTNNVALTGNGNGVSVTDPAGIGTDNVTVGLGANNTISLDHAGGSVAGTGFGLTTVTQAANASRVVTVSLNYGIGAITLGNGSDFVTANGNGTTITAGDGNDTATANGAGAIVTLGNGNDLVNANGSGASVTAGNGNDDVFANGGSATVSLGSGNDIVTATGPLSSVTIAGLPSSTDSVTVGSDDLVRISNSDAQVSGVAGNSIYVNGLQANSNILAAGNNNMLFIGTDSSTKVQLNQAQSGNVILVQADTGNTYSGVIELSDFNTADTLNLEGLVGGLNGQALNSYMEVLQNITAGPVSDTLHLQGGGSIVFDAVTPFKASEFIFGTNTGAV